MRRVDGGIETAKLRMIKLRRNLNLSVNRGGREVMPRHKNNLAYRKQLVSRETREGRVTLLDVGRENLRVNFRKLRKFPQLDGML